MNYQNRMVIGNNMKTIEKMISKNEFVEVINSMMLIDDYQQEKNKLYKKYGADGYLLEPDNNAIILKLLRHALPAEVDFNAIETFCLTNNYGRGKSNQEYIDMDGQKINISTPSELYDYIIKNWCMDGDA